MRFDRKMVAVSRSQIMVTHQDQSQQTRSCNQESKCQEYKADIVSQVKDQQHKSSRPRELELETISAGTMRDVELRTQEHTGVWNQMHRNNIKHENTGMVLLQIYRQTLQNVPSHSYPQEGSIDWQLGENTYPVRALLLVFFGKWK